jgi:hypothetical protein
VRYGPYAASAQRDFCAARQSLRRKGEPDCVVKAPFIHIFYGTDDDSGQIATL